MRLIGESRWDLMLASKEAPVTPEVAHLTIQPGASTEKAASTVQVGYIKVVDGSGALFASTSLQWPPLLLF